MMVRYKSTKKIDELFLKSRSYDDIKKELIDKKDYENAAKMRFKTIEHEKKAWKLILTIYPFLKNRQLQYKSEGIKNFIIVVKENNL